MKAAEIAQAWTELEAATEEVIRQRCEAAITDALVGIRYDRSADRELARRIVRLTRAMADIESGARQERSRNAQANAAKQRAVIANAKKR